ncbi:MAG: tRNA (guanine(46)-N(7))-methyltransferase TrmB, partial [Planctomycetota bacterium]
MAGKLRDYRSISLLPEDLDGQIDFVGVFGRSGPVHIEIGCGKAAFLLNQARAQPLVNFLGLEWARQYYRYAADRMGRWGLTNVRIIRTDAALFVANYLPPESVDCFHIYFPDPWPKRRHHKRRLFSHANLNHIIRALRSDGTLKVVSDHLEYF